MNQTATDKSTTSQGSHAGDVSRSAQEKLAAIGVSEVPLYEIRKKIYPRSVTGWFAGWRWALVWFTQLLFYGLPWLSINGRQSVLFDLEARRFYIFNLVLTPQDFIFLTALLVISALSLFLFTTVAGRLWCGYACPQTVYTEIFLWIERKVEGERGKRIKLDKSPMSARKLRLKFTKHGLWIALALWTGFTFVGYFTPIADLAGKVTSLSMGPWETFWILFYGFATYGNAGVMREQVCIYMCPYARFQGVMFDRDTLVITYDETRGDPKGKRGRKTDKTVAGLGDCIDCGLCVDVCPTGIDIRDGQQYECIGCAACVDACNKVMDKMEYPRGLIRYDTLNGVESGLSRWQSITRIFRLRVILYTLALLAISAAFIITLALRTPLKVDVVRDRATLARELVDGRIENVFRLLVQNSIEQTRSFTISVNGLPGMQLDTDPVVEVGPAGNKLVPVRVRIPANAAPAGSHDFVFTITAADDSAVSIDENARFFIPAPTR
ncbi:MAG: cytochrome c oxidase accessory protein CcoG [Burkholderiaceae bacterium]